MTCEMIVSDGGAYEAEIKDLHKPKAQSPSLTSVQISRSNWRRTLWAEGDDQDASSNSYG